MTAAAVPIAARAVAWCEHVFGDLLVDAEAARWAARIEAEFLAEAGWDATWPATAGCGAQGKA